MKDALLINSTKEESTALCEQILRVDDQRLGDYIGQCTQDEMSRIDEELAIRVGIGLPQQMIDTVEDEMLKKAVDHINEIFKTVIEIQEINKRIEQIKNDSISKFGDFMIEEIRHQYEDEGKSMDQVAADMKIEKGIVSKVVKELGISRPKGRRKK